MAHVNWLGRALDSLTHPTVSTFSVKNKLQHAQPYQHASQVPCFICIWINIWNVKEHKPHLRNHMLERVPVLTSVQNNISSGKKLSLPSMDTLIGIWINNKQQLPWQQKLVKAWSPAFIRTSQWQRLPAVREGEGLSTDILRSSKRAQQSANLKYKRYSWLHIVTQLLRFYTHIN